MIDSILVALPTAADVFSFVTENASYLLVFVFMIIESSFIPFPSEMIVPPAVYLACTNELAGADMNPWLVILFATAGALVGAYVNYYLSLWIGRPLVYRFADSKLGHICLIDRKKVEKSEQYFDKHGAASTFIGRLIPAVRQLISIPAGLSKMNIGVFTLYTTLGALLWNAILGGLGYWLSLYVPFKDLEQAIIKYNHYLTLAGLGLLVLCVAYIAYRVLNGRKKKVAE